MESNFCLTETLICPFLQNTAGGHLLSPE
uniref:Uncharacterized protein n=1 Tax=Anguilla anguilla TaxID=7936 RepID=A0A0E9TML5_ANGAN